MVLMKNNVFQPENGIDLFIYGTLLPGCRLEKKIIGCSRRGPVLLEGAELYDLGTYPGMVLGRGTVVGEWITVSPDALILLDKIEGYQSALAAEDCPYLRRPVEVTRFADGQRVRLQSYLLNQDPKGLERINHGCYRRHLVEKQTSGNWILAYGSNLSTARLEERVGKLDRARSGWIPEFRLVFNKQSRTDNQHTAANIQFDPTARTPAVAWWLESNQISELDRYEGVPNHYLRIVVPFVDRSHPNEVEYLQGYVAHPDQLLSGRPSEKYLSYLKIGYQEHGLDLLEIKDQSFAKAD